MGVFKKSFKERVQFKLNPYMNEIGFFETKDETIDIWNDDFTIVFTNRVNAFLFFMDWKESKQGMIYFKLLKNEKNQLPIDLNPPNFLVTEELFKSYFKEYIANIEELEMYEVYGIENVLDISLEVLKKSRLLESPPHVDSVP